MKYDNMLPTGELMGDDKSLPDRSTRTGVTDTYDADLGADATNRTGSCRRDTRSDHPGVTD